MLTTSLVLRPVIFFGRWHTNKMDFFHWNSFSSIFKFIGFAIFFSKLILVIALNWKKIFCKYSHNFLYKWIYFLKKKKLSTHCIAIIGAIHSKLLRVLLTLFSINLSIVYTNLSNIAIYHHNWAHSEWVYRRKNSHTSNVCRTFIYVINSHIKKACKIYILFSVRAAVSVWLLFYICCIVNYKNKTTFALK